MDTGIDLRPRRSRRRRRRRRGRMSTHESSRGGTSSETTTTRIPGAPTSTRCPTRTPSRRLQRSRHARRRHRRRQRRWPGRPCDRRRARRHIRGLPRLRLQGLGDGRRDDRGHGAAQADGMHVLNMSIGDAFNNWAGVANGRCVGRSRGRRHGRRRVDRQQRRERDLLRRRARRGEQGDRRGVLRQQPRADLRVHDFSGRHVDRLLHGNRCAGPPDDGQPADGPNRYDHHRETTRATQLRPRREA